MTTAPTPDLLPCPFCGGPVTMEEAHPTRSRMYGERRWWGVICRNTINLGGSCAIHQIPSASIEAATERWNRRAELEARKPLPLSDEQIEGLREQTFSTNNPFCPCDSKTMRKAVRAAERAHGITGGSS